MKSKTILGADGATKMRQITVGIHGKGGEAGISPSGTVITAIVMSPSVAHAASTVTASIASP